MIVAARASPPHPPRRTNADKRAAVTAMLVHPEHRRLSDRAIGRRCGVSYELVRVVRAELSVNGCQMPSVRRVTRGGLTYLLDVTNIGVRPESPPGPECAFCGDALSPDAKGALCRPCSAAEAPVAVRARRLFFIVVALRRGWADRSSRLLSLFDHTRMAVSYQTLRRDLSELEGESVGLVYRDAPTPQQTRWRAVPAASIPAHPGCPCAECDR